MQKIPIETICTLKYVVYLFNIFRNYILLPIYYKTVTKYIKVYTFVKISTILSVRVAKCYEYSRPHRSLRDVLQATKSKLAGE